MGGVDRRWRGNLLALLAGIAQGTLMGLIALAILYLLGGCAATKYVPVETISYRDSVRLVERVDSIHVHDSVYIHQWHERDTTWVEKVTVHTRYRDRWRVDTILIHRRDSVPYPVPVTKEVIKYQLRWWQKPLVWLGGLTLIGLAVWWLVRARERA